METRRVAGRRRVGPCGRARYKWSGGKRRMTQAVDLRAAQMEALMPEMGKMGGEQAKGRSQVQF